MPYTVKGNWKYFYKGEKMQAVTAIFYNKIFVSIATGWLVAQVLKTIIHLFFFTKQFIAERLVGSGGMPSSHSATVCAFSTAVAILYGSESFEFAISLILALILE